MGFRTSRVEVRIDLKASEGKHSKLGMRSKIDREQDLEDPREGTSESKIRRRFKRRISHGNPRGMI